MVPLSDRWQARVNLTGTEHGRQRTNRGERCDERNPLAAGFAKKHPSDP